MPAIRAASQAVLAMSGLTSLPGLVSHMSGQSVLPCAADSFSFPDLGGAVFTSIEANPVYDVSDVIPHGLYPSHESTVVDKISYCNISVEYTHPGWNDSINTQVWLPLTKWNGRLQQSGGGSFQTGLFYYSMLGAVTEGFATVSTNGGHVSDQFEMDWVLSSAGNINWLLMQDFSSVSIYDAAIIGKDFTRQFYGRAPLRSYFNGCSQGGRQGLMMAQRHPEVFDGILAAAPALGLPKLGIAEYWPQMVMNEARAYPHPCELNALTEAAIEACDELDGIKDGIISSPELCTFNALSMIGSEVKCSSVKSGTVVLSELAVKVAEAAWGGPRRLDGSFLWHGLGHEALLTGPNGLANTKCDEETGCELNVMPVPSQFVKFWVERDPHFDLKTLTREQLIEMFHHSQQDFSSMFSNDDADLTDFHRYGGKMISWHGLKDSVIMPNGTRTYYDSVMAVDSRVQDYYRYFEAPGVGHCMTGPGPYPGWALLQLILWVEEGIVPDTLWARSAPSVTSAGYNRHLCAYPKKVKFKGKGDILAAESFECV